MANPMQNGRKRIPLVYGDDHVGYMISGHESLVRAAEWAEYAETNEQNPEWFAAAALLAQAYATIAQVVVFGERS